jgi:two-component system, NtrC family, sensor kinase
MRLALKLLSSLAMLTVVLLGASAYLEHQRRDEILAMDIEAEGRMAKTLRAVVQEVCQLAGPGPARDVIETVNVNSPRDVRWLEPEQLAPLTGPRLAAEVLANMKTGDAVWSHRLRDGELTRYIYIPVAHVDGTPLAVIEASESMAPRSAFVARAQVQTATVGLMVLALSGALAALLGRRMIGQPVAALRRSVRALGDGEVVLPVIGKRRDELGSLASELSALGERLAERERLRHDDRLRTVGQLASGVAHELGTPLSVIAVRARLIASGEAIGAEAVANATAILEQTERMTRLVRQLLDYSRRTAVQATDVDLRKASIQAVEMLEPLARAQGVAIVAESEGSNAVVRGDASQLQQVLTNLVLNGIQAMPAGGRLEVRCGRDVVAAPAPGSRPVDRCWLRVTDAGAGIPPDELARVFEPFFTTKSAGEGTGLGLAVAQAIVEEHGGWIAVQSQPGRGAAFTVYLPPVAEVAGARLAS